MSTSGFALRGRGPAERNFAAHASRLRAGKGPQRSPLARRAVKSGLSPALPPASTRHVGQVGGWPAGLAASAGGGLGLWLAFPPHGVWGAAVLGPLSLGLATRGRRCRTGAVLGTVLGLAFMVPLLKWTGVFVGDLPWLALSAVQASFYGLLGAASALVHRLPWAPLWTATLWVALEAARSRVPFGGFPWGRIGFSQADGPFGSLARFAGVAGTTFAVALTGTLLATALAQGIGWAAERSRRRMWCSAGVVVLALIPAAIGAAARTGLPGPSLTAGGRNAVVAVIQGNVPRAGLAFNEQRRAVLDNHVQQTLQLAERIGQGLQPQPDLIVWPENSSDIDPYRNADAAVAIQRAAQAVGAPILVGAVLDGPGKRLTNAAIAWDPLDGPGSRYAKRHPVPFGEYMPWRPFFRLFSKQVDLLRRDFVAGTEPGMLDLGGVRVGDLICFEVAYDGLVSDVVDGGASILVVQTNNATFGSTPESEQQLAMSRLRAIEHGRTVVVAATSGISAVIAPDGTVVRRSQLFTPKVFVEPIAQRTERTMADRLGAVPEAIFAGVAVAALIVAGALGHRTNPSRRR